MSGQFEKGQLVVRTNRNRSGEIVREVPGRVTRVTKARVFAQFTFDGVSYGPEEAWKVDGCPAWNTSGRIEPSVESPMTVIARQTERERVAQEARETAVQKRDAKHLALYNQYKTAFDNMADVGAYKVFSTTIDGRPVTYLLHISQSVDEFKQVPLYAIKASGFMCDKRGERYCSTHSVYDCKSLELAYGELIESIR